MSAVIRPQLSDQEREEIRKRLYAEKINDYQFILEALGEANPTLASLMKSSLAKGEAFILLRVMQESVKLYIESELAEKAEQELLSSKSVNGKRYLEA